MGRGAEEVTAPIMRKIAVIQVNCPGAFIKPFNGRTNHTKITLSEW